MKLNDYKVGDKVTVFVLGEKRPAKVLDVSDEGVEVELDNPCCLKKFEYYDYNTYLDPATYMKRFLIKHAGYINIMEE